MSEQLEQETSSARVAAPLYFGSGTEAEARLAVASAASARSKRRSDEERMSGDWSGLSGGMKQRG